MRGQKKGNATPKSRAIAADMAALRQRFPPPPPLAAAYQCFSIVFTNAFLLYLVVAGRSSPVAIAVFGILELVVLSVITHLTLIPIPKALRVGEPNMNVPQRIVVLALSLAWMAGIYWISLGADHASLIQLLHSGSVLTALEDLNILWPLLLSAAMAAFGAIGDWSSWHRRGGLFVATMSMSAAPKILTLIVAPIPAVLIGDAVAKNDPAAAAAAWSLVYLAIKCVSELGMLAFQYVGMPDAKSNAAVSR